MISFLDGVNLQLKWIYPIALLMVSVLSPHKLGGLKFIPIYEALTIRAQKTAPPYIAFEEVNVAMTLRDDAWSRLESAPPISLTADNAGKAIKLLSSSETNAKKMVLNEMIITKKTEIVYTSLRNPEDSNWKQELDQSLTPRQRSQLEAAQRRSEVLEKDWNPSSWSDEVQTKLASAGFTQKNQRLIPPPVLPAPGLAAQKVHVAATDSSGVTRTAVPTADVYTVGMLGKTPRDKNISGPLEITGGLAVTNEYAIEIRRTNEGVAREVGRVDLQKGTYNISVDEPSGSIDARLVDKTGQVLGEGSVRISRLDMNQANILGPKLRIEPHANYNGIVRDFYKNTSTPAHTLATLIKGAQEINVKKDGHIAMETMARGSTTILRAAAPQFMQTASLVFAGEEFQTPLFPLSMMRALKEIVSGETQSKSSAENLGAIIWGKVTQDGKTLSGIQVQIENDPSLTAIYFDQFMIPDPKLTATSDNGLYAFVDAEEGFQSLLATRGKSIFGYQNVLVENGSVALGDIENTMKVETVPVRVFDAFTGAPQASRMTLQSVDHEIEAPEGTAVLLLPQVNRLGMLRLVPETNDYVPARYFYNDKEAFLHLPMVPWSWLAGIKSFLKIDDQPDSGTVVGFVSTENFEVYLAGYDEFPKRNIVFFDVQGKITEDGVGHAGGGFILYNVPKDTHEVVVVGSKTQKVSSKVLPVDAQTLSVLSFRE